MKSLEDYEGKPLENFRKMLVLKHIFNYKDEETGEDKEAVEALVPRSPKVKDTEEVKYSMKLGDTAKQLDKVYEMYKVLAEDYAGETEEYEVRTGDTISDVLERTEMDFSQLATLNKGSSAFSREGDLYTGQKIKVRKKKAST